MQFSGKGHPLSGDGMDAVCEMLGTGEPEIWAVLKVETRGFGYLADRRPLILFERHIFHRLTGGKFSAAHPDISNRKPGGYKGLAAEYPRLEKAMELDREAALKSASWGLGQIMGFNHEVAGYGSAEEMVAAFVGSEDAQLAGVGKFISKNAKCLNGIKRRDWGSFAACYNGPDFRKNHYDTRLAAAFATYRQMLPDIGLRAAQAALTYVGIDPGPVDGLPGRRTTGALTDFQEKAGLPEHGILDEDTWDKLKAAAF
ncbi:N-acetylmuramidase domain-containing protein [Mangrovicoccus ximenensis]|uniref:N-acetylmuramidase domain-containing protein n=1 Tax=Mangrovicoccus ximenensis TaxID=1911570 RepID=UPI001F48A148|nr:N-acetylmuramidase domain-containing protein [Mangrovicoccus ximenensis]